MTSDTPAMDPASELQIVQGYLRDQLEHRSLWHTIYQIESALRESMIRPEVTEDPLELSKRLFVSVVLEAVCDWVEIYSREFQANDDSLPLNMHSYVPTYSTRPPSESDLLNMFHRILSDRINQSKGGEERV